MDTARTTRALSLVGLLALLSACFDLPWSGGPDGDDSEDAADGDIDADADADADGDADSGEWTDGDADGGGYRPDGYDEQEALCLDGEDDLEAGLADCETLECLTAARCCRDVAGSWVQGDFAACESPEACGFEPFGPEGGSSAVEVSAEGWLLLSGDGRGEVGALAAPVLDLSGGPIVTFRAALGSDEAPCAASSCRQALGLAFTSQAAASLATGVVPQVGIVLDGELGLARLFVGGREDSGAPLDVAILSEPHTYGFQVREDGRVAFWVARAPGALDPAGDPPDHVSSSRVDLGVQAVRLAVHGRPSGPRAARVGSVELVRRVCDSPNGFGRASGVTPFLPAETGQRAGRPAVIRRPTVAGAPLLMVYETESDLAVATSQDGRSWSVEARRALPEQSRQGYGRVARRAPALAFWGPPGEAPTYHLWLEGEAEGPGAPTAITHATSEDGIEWQEPLEGSVSIEGSETAPWRSAVGSPTVTVEPDGALTMWFIGRDPLTGAASLGRAWSRDGETWSVDDAPVVLEGEPSLELERDGIGSAVVVRRGETYHLWYTGLSGSRTSIGYAVGLASEAGRSFQRLGQVLAAEAPWEGRRVSAPAVLVTGGFLDEPPGLASVMLWYQAGPEGHEAISLAVRAVPARTGFVDFE